MRTSTLGMILVAATAISSGANATNNDIATWKKIASQSGSFTVTGSKKIIRFGSGTKWVTKVIGSGQCTVAFFGRDPAPGVTKECDMWTPVTAQTTPTAPSSYTVQLSWTVPSTRQNGQPLALSELKGYEVYYATDSSASTANDTVLTVTGGTTNTSVISKLPAGTYYFSISAIDSNGVKSPLSSMVSAKVGT